MSSTVAPLRKQRFLEYVDKTQLPQAKVAAFETHLDAIRREWQRTAAWTNDLRILDLGCGLGLYTELFHSRGLKATGVDLDGDLIARARARAAREGRPIEFEIGASDQVPFADESFDIVFANSLLEHVPNWQKSVEEWIRVLAPGGLLWIETTNVLHPRQREFRWLPLYSWWPSFMKRLAVKLAVGPCPALANYTAWPAIHWFSFFQLRDFIEARGLQVRDRFDCMDVARAGKVKRLVRSLAQSSGIGRWLSYLLVADVIVVCRKAGR